MRRRSFLLWVQWTLANAIAVPVGIYVVVAVVAAAGPVAAYAIATPPNSPPGDQVGRIVGHAMSGGAVRSGELFVVGAFGAVLGLAQCLVLRRWRAAGLPAREAALWTVSTCAGLMLGAYDWPAALSPGPGYGLTVGLCQYAVLRRWGRARAWLWVVGWVLGWVAVVTLPTWIRGPIRGLAVVVLPGVFLGACTGIALSHLLGAPPSGSPTPVVRRRRLTTARGVRRTSRRT